MPVRSIDGFGGFTKALAHPARVRILAMLRHGSLCVCQLTAVLELATSTVSAHLSELRRAGLVAEEKKGKWVEYRLTQDAETDRTLEHLFPLFRGDPRVEQDAATVRALRRVPLDTLCRAGLDLNALGIGANPRKPRRGSHR